MKTYLPVAAQGISYSCMPPTNPQIHLGFSARVVELPMWIWAPCIFSYSPARLSRQTDTTWRVVTRSTMNHGELSFIVDIELACVRSPSTAFAAIIELLMELLDVVHGDSPSDPHNLARLSSAVEFEKVSAPQIAQLDKPITGLYVLATQAVHGPPL